MRRSGPKAMPNSRQNSSHVRKFFRKRRYHILAVPSKSSDIAFSKSSSSMRERYLHSSTRWMNSSTLLFYFPGVNDTLQERTILPTSVLYELIELDSPVTPWEAIWAEGPFSLPQGLTCWTSEKLAVCRCYGCKRGRGRFCIGILGVRFCLFRCGIVSKLIRSLGSFAFWINGLLQ